MSDIYQHTKKGFLKLFGRLSLSNLKSSERGTTGNSQTGRQQAASTFRQKDKSKSDHDGVKIFANNGKRYCLKKYIKQFNNNYERQKDCFDENVVLDHKLYVSLASASRNSSFSSSYSGCSSVNKHRIIYPAGSRRFRVNGFLRNAYDFNYEPPVDRKTIENLNTSGKVVFEKVKLNKAAGSGASVDPDTSCAFNDAVSADDDVQWENFLKLRNQSLKMLAVEPGTQQMV